MPPVKSIFLSVHTVSIRIVTALAFVLAGFTVNGQTTISLTNPPINSACEGSSISLTAQSNDPLALFACVLVDMNGGGFTATTPVATTPIGGGFYAITFSSDNFTTGSASTVFTYKVRFGQTSNIAKFGLAGSFFTTNTQSVTINPIPTASISGGTSVCLNASNPAVTITGLGGTAPYTFTYTVNGGSNQTIGSIGNTATLSVPTSTAGTFTYSLVSVQDASSSQCLNTASGSAAVVVKALPTASISGSTTVCKNDLSPNLTITGLGGTAPYTFTYSINGVPAQPIASDAFGNATITVPTNNSGNYSYDLLQVQESSSSACSNTVVSNATVVINPIPVITSISPLSPNVCLGQTSFPVTFATQNSPDQYSITWTNAALTQGFTNVAFAPGNFDAVSGVINVSVPAAPTPGNYTGSLTLKISSSGCSFTGIPASVTVNPLPTASISGTTQVCVNSAAPNITITGAGGTSPYTFTYSVDGGAAQTVVSTGATATISVPTSSAETHTYSLLSVQESSSTACSNTASGTATVTINPLPTATISGTTQVCVNSAAPNITITGAGGTAPYTFTYSIDGGAAQTLVSSGLTATISVPTTSPGTHTYSLLSVQESSSTACSNTASGTATVSINTLPTASISGTTQVCLNSVSPNIAITGAGGSAPYTFTYSVDGGVAQTIVSSGLTATIPVPTTSPGTHIYSLISVQESSSTTCTNTASGTATVTINALPTATISGTTQVCLNAAAPNITITGSGGTAPYTFTYTVDGGAAQTVASSGATAIIPVATGSSGVHTYSLVSVQESSALSCMNTASGTATITINQLPTASITGNAQVCVNSASPNITITGSAGTVPYTFTYSVDGGGPQTVVSTGASATIPVVTTSSGTHTYSLISIQESSSTACSNTASGTATVIINPLPTASISGTSQVCVNSAPPNITLTGTGGTAPYTFSYSVDGGAPQTILSTGSIANISVPTATAGSHTYQLLSVQESGGSCSNSASGSATITIVLLPTASIAGTTQVCLNETTPIVTFTGAGGSAPYTFTYKVNGGATQSVVSTGSIAAIPVSTATSGTFSYTLIAIQENSTLTCNNAATGSAVITVNSLPTVSITNPAAVCSPNTIDLTSTAITTGSTAGLTFSQWTDPAATNPLANPGAVAVSGTYYVKGVDPGTTCSNIQQVSATINPRPTVVINNPSPVCFPNTVDLTAAAITSGSNSGLSFSYWSDINATQSLSNADRVSVSGTYYIKATNSSTSCSQVSTVNVVINQPPTAPTITGATTFCPGSNTTLTSSLSPGTYLWSNGLITQSINVNAGGSFSVTITDGNGCSATSAVKTVTANPLPATPTIAGSNSFCAGSNTTLTASNAAGNYLWSTGETTQSITVNSAGNYSVIVTDLNGCTASSLIKTVSVNALPATPVISGNAAFCVGGSTTLSVSPSPNTYLWSNGLAGQSINVSAAGSYTVTVTDVNGCAATSTAKVITANPLPATPAISGATTFCAGGNTTLTSSLSPGTYSWSNARTTQSITVSTAGPVSVTVKDVNGCSATSAAKNIVVNALPATPVIAGNNAICAGSSTTLSSSATTGNSWSTGSALPNIQVSTAGNYSVTVTDVNGCTATSLPFAVTVNPLPQQPVISGNNAFCAGSSTTLTSTTASSYRWNTGATTRSINVSNAGNYSVAITDANGCTATSPASTVVVNPLPVLRINNPLAVCAPATVDITNGSITAGSTTGISLSYFSNAAASNALAVPSAVAVSGTYYIRGLIAQTGCSTVAAVNVAINAAPVLNVTNPPAVCAPATVDLTAASIVSGSAAGLSYSYWTDPATTKTLTSPATVAVSGIYYIKAIAAGGCSAALPVAVTVGTRPVGTLNNPAVNFICEGTVLQLTTQSNAARYQWFKDQSAIVNATAATYDAAASGNYTVEFISQEGCITEAGNTIHLDLIQKPSLQFASTPGCEGTATSFVNQSTAATSGGISWLWNFGDGSSSNTLSASHVYAAGGQYMVTLTANNASCPSLTDTRQSLLVIPVAQAGTRYTTINAIAKQPFTLSARSFGAAYSWQPVVGLSQPTNQVTTGVLNADTTYTVRITTVAGCVTTDTISVKVALLGEIYVPQAFSPNGDGQNDRLYPNLVAIVKLNYFRIFNRWGNLVFQSADPTPANGWDGKLGGIAQAPGTFTWVAEGVDGAGNIIRRSGSTVLIK